MGQREGRRPGAVPKLDLERRSLQEVDMISSRASAVYGCLESQVISQETVVLFGNEGDHPRCILVEQF